MVWNCCGGWIVYHPFRGEYSLGHVIKCRHGRRLRRKFECCFARCIVSHHGAASGAISSAVSGVISALF